MKKRIIAILLTVTMLLSVFNSGMVVFSAGASTDVKITVLDSNGNNVANDALKVTVTCAYRSSNFGSIRTENRPVTNFGDGVFGYDYSSQSNVQYYLVNATLSDGGRTYTESQYISKYVDSVILTLDEYVEADEWQRFDVYYIADGRFPESFYGYGDAERYGPAGDDTPLLSINVNITKLRSSKYSGVVLYQQNVINTDPDTYDKNIGNTYHFIPAKISDNPDTEQAYIENINYAKAFWDAVVECMDEESVDAFKATGLFNHYIVYCLKNQGSVANPDNHADGILVSDITEGGEIVPIDPPVYVIEMYDYEDKIFAGYTNDEKTIASNPISMEKDILDAYKKHFDQEITWTDKGNGVWEGTYITEENGRKYQYTLEIIQMNAANANVLPSGENGIAYEKKTDTYYLAAFQSKEVKVEQVGYILTYTDGVKDIVFYDQVTPLKKGDKVVAFEGKTDRKDHKFIGWTLEGGDGTVLSQDEILAKYTSVNRDLTFVAVYEVAPSKYKGTVEVILDGYYYTNTATATGTKIDITTVKGDGVSLYVKANDTDYIKLEKTDTGVYSAQLLNGDYKIYYYDGENYVLSSDQHLSINNEDRTRYIFFEYVKYELNGGINGPEPSLEYYDTGAAVKVSDTAPTKDGYIFTGWKDESQNEYQSGSVLSNSIGESYTLTAQWTDAADVYINVTIDHVGNTSGYDTTSTKDDISLELVYTPNVNTPYLETGDKIDIDNQNHPNHSYTYTPDNATEANILETVYTAVNPSVTNVSKNNSYSVTVKKHGYSVASVQTTIDPKNGDVIIDVVLQYAPEVQNLDFEVRVDDNVPSELIPQAAIVKVLAWSYETNDWVIIVQHKNDENGRKPGVRVDINPDTKSGTGSYPVWVSKLDKNGITLLYGYRIIVTALIYPDGTIVETNWSSPENSGKLNLGQLETKPYTIKFGDVTDGENYGGLNGAYFKGNTQIGKLDAVITAKFYNVTFDANGGTVNGLTEQTLENQYKVPGFDGFVPVRDGGYVFDGWELDPNCKTDGEYLIEDIIYHAKWKEPLKIEGMITVGATYEQKNEDGTITIQEIPEGEWIQSLIVLLQKVEPNGYTNTISQQFVSLDYTKDEYYHEGRVVGYGTYFFEGIADLGDSENYRIQVLINNYNPTFQNEDNGSVANSKDYPSYTDENFYDKNFYAVFGVEEPLIATVNVHAHFTPAEFELEYSVNAEQIGDDFRPLEAEVLVTADGQNSGAVPSNWEVISQMIINGAFVGDNLEINDGKGQGSDMVWIGRADGVTNYQYGIIVDEVVLADGTIVQLSDSLPFTVEYQAPAYYMNGGQVGELVAVFVPKTYNITYNTNGGTLSGNYPTSHTWSFETSLAGIVPEFSGFKFDGWYLDKELTVPASDKIDASVASDTTLYAKWIQVMDRVDLVVTIKHDSQVDGGLADNFNKKLYTQLTYAERNASEQNFIDMTGYAKEYPNGQWHTHGDKVKVDAFEVPSYYTHLSAEYDYSVDVKLEGYYQAEKTVVKTEQPDGSTLHTVNVTLQFDPDPFELEFYVAMSEDIIKQTEDYPQLAGVYPQSVEVKVTSWYDDPAIDTSWDWYRITQHEVNTVTVNINAETGYGEGKCVVWHWYDEANNIPYHYRIEVIKLNFANGNTVLMNETVTDVAYSGGGYNATIVVEGGSVPTLENENQSNTTLEGVCAMPSGDTHIQSGKLGAVIDVNKVVFHANNDEALGDDIFRTYYPAVAANGGLYTLNQDGTISVFYDIPEFEYYTHNEYVFMGWYLEKDEPITPINWSDVYNTTTHVYAHWIKTGTVEKDAEDKKNTGGNTYAGFDLIGVQIRDAEVDSGVHYGEEGSGLRFITVLSDELYDAINALGNGNEAEYGFVLAKKETVINNVDDNENYTLQLKGENINGVDTTDSHSYVINVKCSGVEDHYNSDNYRLYTAVITYKNYGESLEEAYNEYFAARSYIRYVDANGLERVYYNNYESRNAFYGGCCTSFDAIRGMMAK